jgi:hypothetical protein
MSRTSSTRRRSAAMSSDCDWSRTVSIGHRYEGAGGWHATHRYLRA